MSDEEQEVMKRKQSEAPKPRRRPKKIVISRRDPSIVIPEPKVVYITADKTTCLKCTCYPKEEPYQKPKKLNPCQKSPLTLYELAAEVVEHLNFPEAFRWSEDQVADWMADRVGLPEYRECILKNEINGLRLIMLEDPSKLPEINIRNFEHIKMISSKVRQEFRMEFIKFIRSICLPPRKPLTHSTWFKSKTGPSWGIRINWSRCDILRWMKIIMPVPTYMDHWDLVWYQKPEYPKVKLARVSRPKISEHIPCYQPKMEVCREYMLPRKFKFQSSIPEEAQMIWMEHRPTSPIKQEIAEDKKKREKKKLKTAVPKDSRLTPKRISLTGLAGKELILARRKMPKPKFLA